MSWEGNKYLLHRHINCIALWFKKVVVIVFLSIGVLFAGNGPSGNEHLKNGDYGKAIEEYESVVKDGYIGHELFFNLATAYSKQGNIPWAILNFEKALRMKPGDKATTQQLIQLNLKLQDRPVIYDDTGLLAFINKVQFSLGIDSWAILSILFMLLVPIAIYISYKFNPSSISGTRFRKLIFMSTFIWFLLSGFSVIMARNNYHYKYLNTEGVVMNESAVAYDGSNTTSKIKFNVHLGTKLKILDSTQTMYKVEFAADNGWILRDAIKKIEL